MKRCPNCNAVVQYKGEDTDILPPPPGTDLPPLVRKFANYTCNHCGHTIREQIPLQPIITGSSHTILGWFFLIAGAAALCGGLTVVSYANDTGGSSGDAAVPLLLGIACLVIGILALNGKIR